MYCAGLQKVSLDALRFALRCVTCSWLVCGMSLCWAENIPVNNGNFGGPGIADVEYINVIQNSVTDPIADGDPGPYGQPTLTANQLSFTAPTFAAIANPDIAHDMTDGFLGFSLAAVDDFAITEIDVYEFGAIQMYSASGGSPDTRTSVLAPIFIEVTELVTANGNILPVPDVMFMAEEIEISPGGSDGWNSYDDPTIVQWIGTLEIDLIAAIAAEYPDYVSQNDVVGVKELNFTMNNILTSAVEPTGSFAFVDKKHTDVRPTVVSVPEPTTFALLFGLLAVSDRCRRQRK